LSVEHAVAALTLVPRNVAFRAVVVVGLLLPWVWLVALDRALRRRG
jgi:hypothetical protein